ncbi:MAG: hypothetical protein U0572_11695 [Phycisphaerales bacterium]
MALVVLAGVSAFAVHGCGGAAPGSPPNGGGAGATPAPAPTPAPSGVAFEGSADAPYSFRHVVEWTVAPGEARPDTKTRDTVVSSPNGSRVEIAIVRDARPPKALLGQIVQGIAQNGYRLGGLGDVRELGAFQGTGQQFAANNANGTARLQVLVVEISETERLVLTTWMVDADSKSGNRAINLITNSLKLNSR